MVKKTDRIVVIADPHTLATELYDIERTIKIFEERAQLMRTELFGSLKSQGVRRVDLISGQSYIIYPRNKLVIKNALKAQKWALENPEARMKLDTTKAIEVALTGHLPWASVKKEEYLRVSRAKSKTNYGDDS